MVVAAHTVLIWFVWWIFMVVVNGELRIGALAEQIQIGRPA